MRRLNRYIGFSVLMASFGTLAVLVGLNVVSDMIDEFGQLEGDYDLPAALQYIALGIPASVYEFLAYATFLGCVIGLSIHANANELVILRAAGVNMRRIVWAVMRPALVLIVVGLILGEYITPLTTQLAESRRDMALGNDRALEAERGLWYRDNQLGEYMHFNAVQPNGRLFGITRYRFNDEGDLEAASFAEQAIYQNGYWQLENGVTSRFFPERVERIRFGLRAWRTDLSPELLNMLVLPPQSLSIRDLWDYANVRDRQGLESREYWLAFWQKVLQPLVIVGLVLVGISFIFGSQREFTLGSRLTLALIFGIVLKVNLELLGTASTVLGFAPLIAVLGPVALLIFVGAWLLRRA